MPKIQTEYGQPAVYNATAPTFTDMDGGALNVDVNGNLKTVSALVLPLGATSLNSASGNVANASAAATLAATAAKTTYIIGFEITAGGATAGALVIATITGVLGGTLSYIFAAPTGAAVGATPLTVEFSTPVPASAVNTAIVLTLPALGIGNTNAAVVAHGFVI